MRDYSLLILGSCQKEALDAGSFISLKDDMTGSGVFPQQVKPSSFLARFLNMNLILLSLFLIGWIGDWSRLMKEGNERYAAADYDAALKAYQSAVERRPKEAISHYNLGTALYQKKRYDEAANEFMRSLDSKDPLLQAQRYYNLGNAQFQSGDLQGAIRSYKSALRLNPDDYDAKYNMELALEKLAEKQSQRQNQSNHHGADSKGQEHQQQPTDNQTKRASTAPQPEESASKPGQNSIQQPDGMSKEDAIRILEAMNDDEKDIQKKLLRKRLARRKRSEKDW